MPACCLLPPLFATLPSLRPSRIDDEGVREASQASQPASSLSPRTVKPHPRLTPLPCPDLPPTQPTSSRSAPWPGNFLFPPLPCPDSGLPVPFQSLPVSPNQPSGPRPKGSFSGAAPVPPPARIQGLISFRSARTCDWAKGSFVSVLPCPAPSCFLLQAE